MLGRVVLSGWRAVLQRHGTDFSRQTVRTGLPCDSRTITAARVNVTVHYSSRSGPTHIKVCLNPGMMLPVTGKS